MTETTPPRNAKTLILISAIVVSLLAAVSTTLFLRFIDKNSTAVSKEGDSNSTVGNEKPVFIQTGNADLKERIAELEEVNSEMKRKITSLNTELDATTRSTPEPDNNTADDIDELKRKLKKVQQVLDAKDTQNELDKAKYTHELKTEVERLRLILRKEKTKILFATSAEDLAPSAQDLVKKLGEFSGEKPEDLEKLYSQLSSSEKSSRKLVVNFESGISGVSEEYKTKIQEMLSSTKPDSYFVAVGYADTVGSSSKNKALSSKRATKVVGEMKPLMKESQFVQAYYLGQTTRFGDPELNRVVEIWEIRD